MKVTISCEGMTKSWVGYEPTLAEIGEAVTIMYHTALYNGMDNFEIKVKREV